MELGEVNPPVLEEGETLLVEIVRSPTPPPQAVKDEEEEPVLICRRRPRPLHFRHEKKAATKVPKKDWSLDVAVEEDVLKWLKGNSYLWMRNKKSYKQKRAAWEMKAQEVGISVEHLEQWWKGIKDWYVKLSKKTSGQVTKMLTERETWVLQHCGFYKSSISSDTREPVVTVTRVPSASANATSTVSRPLPSVDSDDDSKADVLEDMEPVANVQASTSQPSSKSSLSRKRDKRRREEGCQEERDTWMRDLCATMQANQALLEKLVEEKRHADREPFVRFVADTLRSAPQEQYDEMKDLIFDILRHGRHRKPGDSEQPSKSWARPAQAVSPPPACTASQLSPHPVSQPFSCQQQHHPQYQLNGQSDSSFMQQTSFSGILTPTQHLSIKSENVD